MGVVASDHGLVALPSRSLIGRSSSCHVRLEDRTVSAEHAVLAYVRGRWSVRDLGSRNGTRVDGALLKAGERIEVSRGASIECGSSAMKLLEDGAPGPAIVRPDGTVVESGGSVLAIPSPEKPIATVVQGGGGWVVEHAEGVKPLVDGDTFEIDGAVWRVLAPTDDSADVRSTVQPLETPLVLGRLTLEFFASRDEEYVEVLLREANQRISARAANYLLMVLARERSGDSHLPEADRGWVYSSDLAKKLSFDLERLNVEVFRARSALSALGVVDAGRIIERRAVTRQLRIGTERFVLPESRTSSQPSNE
ncbi:MAG: FHA domain-containing protein [Myxococcales bacterium]|nr:FHA domain-containing protein [Myxococcales bacterium]